MMYDRLALNSDAPRSFKQAVLRKVARAIVDMLGLNGDSDLATEILQAASPIAQVTKDFVIRSGHGRLVWRAESFFVEEPETVKWLETFTTDDVYWDIGANVGLYAIYAAKFYGCKVYAFEPESQNYALMIENIVLNGVTDKVLAAPIALDEKLGLGILCVPFLSKGRAYNNFTWNLGTNGNGYQQLCFAFSVDSMIAEYGLTFPTRMKIDVDGNEPLILRGCQQTLRDERLRSVIVERNSLKPDHFDIKDIMKNSGFRLVSEVSVWESKRYRSREQDQPEFNMLFSR